MIDSSHVRRVADRCTSFLRDVVDADWSVRVPDLDLSVAGVVAHMCVGCLWYTIDLSAGGKDLGLIELQVDSQGEPSALVDTLATGASLLGSVIEAAPPTARGFHPMGTADPSGFAAMACDEMLIHTRDVANGLGIDFSPQTEEAEAVLRRLFPWVAVEADPWELLQWSNGRVALEGRPRLSGWIWHCAPLDEWDGSDPTAAPGHGR